MRPAPGFEDALQQALTRRAKAALEHTDALPLRIKLGERYQGRSKRYPPVRIVAELQLGNNGYEYGKRFLGDDGCTYRPDGGFRPEKHGTHQLFDLVEEAPTIGERLSRWWARVRR